MFLMSPDSVVALFQTQSSFTSYMSSGAVRKGPRLHAWSDLGRCFNDLPKYTIPRSSGQNNYSEHPSVQSRNRATSWGSRNFHSIPSAYSTDQSMTLAGLDSQGRPRDPQQSPVTRSTEAEQRDLPPQENLAERALCHCRFSALMRPLCSGTPVQRNQKAKQAQKHM